MFDIRNAKPTAVARPYARAAFEDASYNKVLPLWSELLKITTIIVYEPDVRKIIMLCNPLLSRTQKAEFLIDLCNEFTGEQIPINFNLFIKLLAELDRLEYLPSIYFIFEQLRTDFDGTLHAEFISASNITESQRKRVLKALKTKLKRNIILDYKVDPYLIAGYQIRFGDRVIDSSARGRLEKLNIILSQ